MPEMNGIETLKEIRKTDKITPIIMLSSLTRTGAEMTFEALSCGATDYLLKPAKVTNFAETIKELNQLLLPKLKAHADLYKAELEAKGTLLEKEASAEGERLKATALNTPGGENLVAYELVDQLNISEITVSTQSNDFLDVETLLQKVGASAE